MKPFKPKVSSILKPISKNAPCGTNIKYLQIFDDIKNLRTKDEDYLPKGVWEETQKNLVDHKKIVQQCFDVLQKQSKDLQVLCWLTEALCYTRGLKGLVDGLNILHACIQKFWPTLYPLMSENDSEERLHIFAWLQRTLSDALLEINITEPQDATLLLVTFGRYIQVKHIAQKTKLSKDDEALRAYAEEVQKSVKSTFSSFYDGICNDAQCAKNLLDQIQNLLVKNIGDDAQGVFYTAHQKLESLIEDMETLRKTARQTPMGRRIKDKALSLVTRPSKNKTEKTLALQDLPSADGKRKTLAAPQHTQLIDLTAIETLATQLTRESAYEVLEQVSTFLNEDDAQSPLPTLLTAVCHLRKKSFSDIVKSFESPSDAMTFFDQASKLSKK